jgi:DNA-directed RNA polymerase specialized sigma24 family protein
MAPRKTTDEPPIPVEQTMAALLALTIADREQNRPDDSARTEVILSNAGLRAKDIARLTGKNEGTVQKAIERARKAKPRTRKKA